MSRSSSLVAAVAALGLLAAGLAAEVPAPSAPGDAFADAIPQPGTDWSASVTTVGATVEAGEAVATDDPTRTRQASVWLQFTPESDVAVDLSATGAAVAVFEGTALDKLEQLAFSAEGSVSDIHVTRSATYYVQVAAVGEVDAAATGEATITLAARKPAPDPTADPNPDAAPSDKPSSSPRPGPSLGSPGTVAALAPSNDNYGSGSLSTLDRKVFIVDNTDATTQSGEQVFFDPISSFRLWGTVWMRWKAPASGSATFSTQGSAVGDTGLAVYTGSTLATSKRLGVNDDATPAVTWARLDSVAVTKGTVYYIQVGTTATTASSPRGAIEVGVSGLYLPPSNDHLNKAIGVGGSSFSVSGTTIGSTIESEWESVAVPDDPSAAKHSSVWWKWRAPASGTMDATTGSVNFGDYINVFESTELVAMRDLGFSQETFSAGSLNDVPIVAGRLYYFQVGDTNPIARGVVDLSVTATLTGPVISTLSTTQGALAGGQKITITGARLSGVTSAAFGLVPSSSISIVSSTKIVVRVPAGVAKGKVPVRVFTATASSAITSSTYWTYI